MYLYNCIPQVKFLRFYFPPLLIQFFINMYSANIYCHLPDTADTELHKTSDLHLLKIYYSRDFLEP